MRHQVGSGLGELDPSEGYAYTLCSMGVALHIAPQVEGRPREDLQVTEREKRPDQQEIPEEQPALEQSMPVVPLPGMVLLPHMIVAIRVSDARTLAAVTSADAGDKLLLIAPGPELAGEEDGQEESYETAYDDNGRPVLTGNVGVMARIEQVTEDEGDDWQVALRALQRMLILDIEDSTECAIARCRPCPEPELTELTEPELPQLMERALTMMEYLVDLVPGLPSGVLEYIRKLEHPGHLADQTGYFPEYNFEERLQILSELDPVRRLEKTTVMLKKYVGKMQLRAEILAEVKDEIDSNQREIFLREQLRVIKRELGEDDTDSWLLDLRHRLEQADPPPEVMRKAERESDRLSRLGPHVPETAVIQNYLEWLAGLPWSTETTDSIDLEQAAAVLNEDHYGLDRVKERILEYLAVRKLAGDKLKAPILCFVGPPGVGKTSLGRSIARVMGRRFVRVSLGGMHDEAEIRGHRRTYVGAMPGRVVQGMREVGSRNPVFMLDEIDKVGRDFRGDPAAALLEALDPEQNHAFTDHYLEVPFDLSHTMFITTANTLDTIPPALRDRMEVISIAGYAEDEKLAIARDFLLPKQIVSHGLRPEQVQVREDALLSLIREYTHEAGVRGLERSLAAIARKLARRVVENKIPRSGRFIVRAKDLQKYLGPPPYECGLREASDQVGVATGVAVTEAGGEVLPVEVCILEGKGELLLTGQLGDVMKESAQAALTYARSRLADLGLDSHAFEKHDVHIHVPAGAIPKDGPSAGIAMATALLSAVSGRPVRREVAMTGEITLRGRVLPIGGLKEKVLAAKAAGITEFVLPARNQKDLPELSPFVRRGVRLITVEHMDEVLGVALAPGDEYRSDAAEAPM